MPSLKEITYNCRQATFLIEKKQYGGITIKEHLQLKYHLAGCSVCRIYQKQSEYIGLILQKAMADFNRSHFELGSEFKKELQGRISEKLRGI
jgi:hypothetical protein